MSCEQQSNRVARFVCQISSGISQLSSKQAFYAGVAVGASGTGLGTLAIAKRGQLARLVGLGSSRTRLPRQAISKPEPRPVPGLPGSTRKPKPIPNLPAAPETKLQAAPIELRDRRGKLRTSPNSYRVLRPDGSETGLAITPYLEQADGQATETEKGWGLTHIGTGALIEGPFENIAQTQGLATKLSTLGWTASSLSKADVTRAKQIIKAYRQAAQAKET